jgi:hypothetical protein
MHPLPRKGKGCEEISTSASSGVIPPSATQARIRRRLTGRITITLDSEPATGIVRRVPTARCTPHVKGSGTRPFYRRRAPFIRPRRRFVATVEARVRVKA